MSGNVPRIVAADDEEDIREYVQEALSRLGYSVETCADGRQLVELAAVARPDLVISDIKMPHMDGIEAALTINQKSAIPVILLSAHDDDDLVIRAAPAAANIMAWLIKPVQAADLKTAIPLALARFGQLRKLADETASLRQALEDRKIIERSKGVVMRRLRIDEQDAFQRMRRFASNHNRKLIDLCRQLIEADIVFAQLEQIG